VAERLTFNHGARPLAPRRSGRGDALPGFARRFDVPPPGAAAADTPDAPVVRAWRPERADASYWGVFVFTALLFFRPQDALPMLEPLHLPEIAAVLALVSMAVWRSSHGLPPVPMTPELGAVGAVGAAMVLTAPFSIWPSGALATFTDLFFKVLLIFMLLTHALTSPRLLRRFTWLIVAAMGYVSVRGVLDYARGENLLLGRLQGAVPGLMGNPNDLAMNMVVFLPFAAFAALGPGRRAGKALAALVSLLMVATLLFTKSRGGMLALAVTGLLIVIQARRFSPVVTAVMLVGALAVPPLLPQSFWTRASSIFNAEEDETGSRDARMTLMQDGWRAFLEHPLTGVGAGQFQNYNPAWRQETWRETHNVELQVLAELGLAGGLAFVFMLARAGQSIAWTWRMVRRRRRPSGDAAFADAAFEPHERAWMQLHVAACISAFAGWIVCAQFGSIGYYWTLYYVIALIAAGRLITVKRLAWARRDRTVVPA
jgi:putative inorganic carbon (hco3(-)) transporter